jgi:hypothetical protein
MKVTCIKEYKLIIDTKHIHTFNVGESFSKIVIPNKNLNHTKEYIQIDVEHLNLSVNNYEYYLIIVVPKSNFLTIEEIRDNNINKILN